MHVFAQELEHRRQRLGLAGAVDAAVDVLVDLMVVDGEQSVK